MRVGAGVFSHSSGMQKTRPFWAAARLLPSAIANDLLQRDAISGTAPRGDDDVRISGTDGVSSGVLAGFADEIASGGFDEFCDPELRVNDGLSPFFAEDAWARSRWNERADFGYCVLHICDDRGGTLWFAEDASDERDVGIDVGEAARG